MTIKDPDTIAKILNGQGNIEGTPTQAVFSYHDIQGQKAFAVFLPGTEIDVYNNPYVQEPIKLLSENLKTTKAGQKFLENLTMQKTMGPGDKSPITAQEETAI